MNAVKPRAGVTMLELAVAIVIIGLGTTVVLVAWEARGPGVAVSTDDAVAWTVDARRLAITTGRPQALSVRIDHEGKLTTRMLNEGGGSLRRLVAYPDGSVVADSMFRVERFSGRATPDAAAR